MKTNQKGISHLLLPLIIILVAAITGTFYLVSSKADQVTPSSSNYKSLKRQQTLLNYSNSLSGSQQTIAPDPDATSDIKSGGESAVSTSSNKGKIIDTKGSYVLMKWDKKSIDGNGKNKIACGQKHYVFNVRTAGKVDKVTVRVNGNKRFMHPNGDFTKSDNTLALTNIGSNNFKGWIAETECQFLNKKVAFHSERVTIWYQNQKISSKTFTWVPSYVKAKF
jgi:uncharacterized protein (UPF0333 family)